MTFEQQIAAIMDGATINTVQITATRQADGTVYFYTALHADDVKCVFSEYMDKPTAHEAITSADIYAHVRSVMKPEDRAQADIERAFYEHADRFDVLAAEARQLVDAMRGVA